MIIWSEFGPEIPDLNFFKSAITLLYWNIRLFLIFKFNLKCLQSLFILASYHSILSYSRTFTSLLIHLLLRHNCCTSQLHINTRDILLNSSCSGDCILFMQLFPFTLSLVPSLVFLFILIGWFVFPVFIKWVFFKRLQSPDHLRPSQTEDSTLRSAVPEHYCGVALWTTPGTAFKIL